MHYHFFILTVPLPLIILSVPNDQTVGESVTLECSIFTVRGIKSTVDVKWRSDDIELERSINIKLNTTNNSMLFKDTYTISQLSTADEDKTYQCEVSINTLSPVTGYDNVTLNVTGKKNIQVAICSNFTPQIKEYCNAIDVYTVAQLTTLVDTLLYMV